MHRRTHYTRAGLTIALALIITAYSQGSTAPQNSSQINYSLITVPSSVSVNVGFRLAGS